MAEYDRETVRCKNCIHNEVCFYREMTNDIDEWLDEFGCEHYKPTADVVKVRRGAWMLKAHKEATNYGWNVTAECSNCCDGEKEIWRGHFPNVPDWLARDVALQSAESVKLDNYCPNCGAKMDEKDTVTTCKDCKHLMFSDCYGECNKQLRIVNPSDTCEYAEPKDGKGD